MKMYKIIITFTIMVLLAYISGYFIFRSYSFYWTDLDGTEHHSTVNQFRNASYIKYKTREWCVVIFLPIIKIDRVLTGRELDDEM